MSGKPKAVPQTSDAGNLKPKGEPELKELVAEKSKSKARVPEGGYPREALMDLHSTAILAADRKELKKLIATTVFAEMRPQERAGTSVIVDKPSFLQAFDDFTSSIFSELSDSLWDNLLVAGGAVLAR